MPVVNPQALNPTLWRTCRVLANKIRLRVLRELSKRPEQSVSDVARRLGLSLSLASQSLRALNARGLLVARRSGRSVCYSACADRSIPDSAGLLDAILQSFVDDKRAEANIFRYTTAFTHPRRVLVIRSLSEAPMRLHEIRAKTGISPRALCRHLRKLIARGFVKRSDGLYMCTVPKHVVGKLLLRLAAHM